MQNKCNVGYAFINMVSPSHIIPFFKVYFDSLLIHRELLMAKLFFLFMHDLLVERSTMHVPVGMGLLTVCHVTMSSCRVIAPLALKFLNFCADI